MTKHSVLAAVAAFVLSLAAPGAASAAPGVAPPPFEPAYRDLAVSITDITIDRAWDAGAAWVYVDKVGVLDNPGNLEIRFRIWAADSVWLEDLPCPYHEILGRFTCTIPNRALPRTRGIPLRLPLFVQSHQVQFVPRNETWGVEIFPGDADRTNDRSTARVYR